MRFSIRFDTSEYAFNYIKNKESIYTRLVFMEDHAWLLDAFVLSHRNKTMQLFVGVIEIIYFLSRCCDSRSLTSEETNTDTE